MRAARNNNNNVHTLLLFYIIRYERVPAGRWYARRGYKIQRGKRCQRLGGRSCVGRHITFTRRDLYNIITCTRYYY